MFWCHHVLRLLNWISFALSSDVHCVLTDYACLNRVSSTQVPLDFVVAAICDSEYVYNC